MCVLALLGCAEAQCDGLPQVGCGMDDSCFFDTGTCQACSSARAANCGLLGKCSGYYWGVGCQACGTLCLACTATECTTCSGGSMAVPGTNRCEALPTTTV